MSQPQTSHRNEKTPMLLVALVAAAVGAGIVYAATPCSARHLAGCDPCEAKVKDYANEQAGSPCLAAHLKTCDPCAAKVRDYANQQIMGFVNRGQQAVPKPRAPKKVGPPKKAEATK